MFLQHQQSRESITTTLRAHTDNSRRSIWFLSREQAAYNAHQSFPLLPQHFLPPPLTNQIHFETSCHNTTHLQPSHHSYQLLQSYQMMKTCLNWYSFTVMGVLMTWCLVTIWRPLWTRSRKLQWPPSRCSGLRMVLQPILSLSSGLIISPPIMKLDWDLVEVAFKTCWPKVVLVAETTEKRRRKLRNEKLLKADICAMMMANGMEMSDQACWAGKIQTLTVLVDNLSGALIHSVWNEMPQLMKKLVKSTYLAWIQPGHQRC